MGAALSQQISDFQALYRESKAGELNSAQRDEYKALEAAVESGLQLIRVEPHPDTLPLQRQLVGADVVHSLGTETLERLCKMRLGYEDDLKQAFVLANPEDDFKVYSGIYAFHADKPVDAGGSVRPRDVPGDVSEILNAHQRRIGAFNTAAFYSVVNMSFVPGANKEDYLPGVARMMIRRIRTHYKDAVEGMATTATLSPFRKFGAFFDNMQQITGQSDEQIQRQALRFILNNTSMERALRDDVMGFHMGNGAEVYDINLRANERDSVDDRLGKNVMVNYRYPLDDKTLSENQQRFREGAITIAPHLMEQLIGDSAQPTQSTAEGSAVWAPGQA